MTSPHPSARESDSLEDELTCPVCLDLFADPVVLPCSHSLCRECLRRTVASVGCRCPQCRRDLTSTFADRELDVAVSALPRNLALASFVARHRDEQQRLSRARERQLRQAELASKLETRWRATSGGGERLSTGTNEAEDEQFDGLSCEMCQGDAERQQAELYCPQCEVAYCSDCLRRYHPGLGPLRLHAVVQLAGGDGGDGGDDILRKIRRSLRCRQSGQSSKVLLDGLKDIRRHRRCTSHPTNQIRLHCVTCNVGVCTDCLAVDSMVDENADRSRHAGHSLITLTAAAQSRAHRRRELGKKAASLAAEVDREAAATRRARDRLRQSIVESRRCLELLSRRAALDLMAVVQAARAEVEDRAAALDDATEASARLDRQLAAQSRLSSRLTRVSRQLLHTGSTSANSARISASGGSSPAAAQPDSDDEVLFDDSAYQLAASQFERCSVKARCLADSGAEARSSLDARAAEVRQLPDDFSSQLRRHLAEVWLLALKNGDGCETAGVGGDGRDRGQSTSAESAVPVPSTRSSSVSKLTAPTAQTKSKANNNNLIFPREASTWGFATAVFSPDDFLVSNGTRWTLLINWTGHSQQLGTQFTDVVASTGVSERPISSSTNLNLLLGSAGFGFLVTDKCVAFVARGGELAQRCVCRLPLTTTAAGNNTTDSNATSSSMGSFGLRLQIQLSIPAYGPASVAYEIAELLQGQQADSVAAVRGVEILGTKCCRLYPVLCVTNRVRVQVLEQPTRTGVDRQ